MANQHETQRILVIGGGPMVRFDVDVSLGLETTFEPDVKAAAGQILQQAFQGIVCDFDSLDTALGLKLLRHARRCAPDAELVALREALPGSEVRLELDQLGCRLITVSPTARGGAGVAEAVADLARLLPRGFVPTATGGTDLAAFARLVHRTGLLLGERDVTDLLGRLGPDLAAVFHGVAAGVLSLHESRADIAIYSGASVPEAALRGIEAGLVESCTLRVGTRPVVGAVQLQVFTSTSGSAPTAAPRPWFLIPASSDGELAGLILAVGPGAGRAPGAGTGLPGLVAQHLRDTLCAFDKLQIELRRDSLTSLPGHGYLQPALCKAWAQRARGAVGFLMLDVDNFKALNDSYGHRVGDAVLVELADLLRGRCPATGEVIRYGGDEMALIFRETEAARVQALGADILARVRDHVFTRSGVVLRLTVSIGMAVSGDTGVESGADLLELADRALYLAKRSGRNQMCSSADLTRSRATAVATAARNQEAPYAPVRVGSGTVLVVDDEPAVRALLARMLSTCRYDVLLAASAAEALRLIESGPDRVDVLLADVRMPEMDGIELLERVRALNPNIIAVVITGFASPETTVAAMRAGAYDLVTKPFNIHELKIILGRAVGTRYLMRQLAAYHLHTEELLREKTKALHDVVDRLRASYFKTMEAIVRLLDIHETSTAAHSRRVSEVTVLLASRMGVGNPAEMEVIRFGALLHDIGKLGVPDAIINKPAALTDAEREVVRTHPELGYQMLRTIPEMEDIAQLVYSHHERYDGTGYPRGLKGEQTCLGARIFAVVDAYDALRHDRCYRAAQEPEKVLAEIMAGRGTQFDPAVVDAFVAHFAELELAWLREERRWEADLPA